MARASMRWSLAIGVVSASWLVNAPAHAIDLVLLSQERSVEVSTRYVVTCRTGQATQMKVPSGALPGPVGVA